MTSAEEQAKRCLEKNIDSALNDSWYLPVDLETRIIAAIESAHAEGWNAAVEACVEIADKDAAMDYTASMIRVQIMGLLITDKTCAFSTAKAEYPTDKRSLGLRFVEDGYSYLDAISGEDVCNDESCIACRITKLLFEVESRWKPEIVKAEAAKAE